MAGSALFTAVLDANVLYPICLTDVLLSLAQAGIYHARWTQSIHDEWISSLVRNDPRHDASLLRKRADAMNNAVPDSVICGYDKLADCLELPDPKDRHVLAAAIVGHADAIVTFNLNDFPKDVLEQYSLEAIHPDDFVVCQLELKQIEALEALKQMRARKRSPPRTVTDIVQALERVQLPRTAALIQKAAALI